MKINPEILVDLRNHLKRGSAEEIRRRLITKSETEFSIAYVYRVLDPNQDAYNCKIIDEAFLYAEELAAKKASKEKNLSTRLSELKKVVL